MEFYSGCIDKNQLLALRFSKNEVDTLTGVINRLDSWNKKPNRPRLLEMGFTYEQADRLLYMYNILIGKITIHNKDDFISHLKKLSKGQRKIGIQDLMVSTVQDVPRKAVVSGISDPIFSVWNSKELPLPHRQYDVINVTSSNIWVKTNIRPILKYKQSKKIDGVFEILEVHKDYIVVSFNKKYCRLCNRFIVVGSLRRPEFHLGMYEIICSEGTKVYIFGQTLAAKDIISYNGGTQRVYGYGFFKSEISEKINIAANMVYKKLGGVYSEKTEGNKDFLVLPVQEEEKKEEDYIIED